MAEPLLLGPQASESGLSWLRVEPGWASVMLGPDLQETNRKIGLDEGGQQPWGGPECCCQDPE